MKKYIFIFTACVSILINATVSMASPPPVLTLSNNGTSVQVIVTGADPNAAVKFFYPTAGQSTGSSRLYSSVNIGQTDAYGNLTTSVNAGSYGLVTGNPVYVSVDGIQSANLAWPSLSNAAPATMVLSQTAVTLTIGQSVTVNANNVTGTLSIPGNTNPSIANVTLNGNSIILNGLSAGNAVITVCASGSGCSSLNVTVQPSYLGTSGVILVPNNFSISAGQSQTVSISGYASGPYYVSNNTGSNYVSAAVNGNNLILTGLAAGSSNITVCASSGQCANEFVTISAGSASPVPAGNTTTVISNQPPVVSSLNVSSNGANGSFVGTGNTITLTMNANQSVLSPTISIGGTVISASGSGNGPYVASYSMTGRETMPMPVSVSLTNLSGQSSQAYIWIGNSAASAPAPVNTAAVVNAVTNAVAPVPAQTPAPAVPSAAESYSFKRYLYMGMTASGVADPDVYALQQRLKADGAYSGPITGYFGPQTKAGVVAYQNKHGLTPLGVVGPSTRALLNQGI